MPVVICLMRGVNVGGRNRLPMEEWRALLEEAGGSEVSTYVQSGNAVMRVKRAKGLAARIEKRIEARYGFRAAAVVRTKEEWRAVVEGSPYAGKGLPGDRVTATFFPEGGHEYRYFPEGIGKAKDAVSRTGTMRNWNTVEALWRLALEQGGE
jgi:uncharacterized protein (DUF1697 family)